MKTYVFILLSLLLSSKSEAKPKPDQTINSTFKFELEKYLGTWYEIARFDHSFERGLQGVTANYSLRSDGKIEVLNKGFRDNLDGAPSEAIGKAKLASHETPRYLKVSFFWFFYAPYNILEIDENYQYVLIGSNSSKYLWILSRTPKMDPEIYDSILAKAKVRGYDISKLIKVDQPD